MMLTKHTILIEGHTFHYQVAGKGEPVIMIHGLSASTRWWIRNVAALAEHYRVYLVDLPGFGQMRNFREPFAILEAASWLLKWMQAIGIKQAHFIGHSMGGYLCLWLAAHHPARVWRLVLFAPAGVSTAHTLPVYILRLLTALRYVTPSFLPILFSDAMLAGPLTLLRAAQDLITKDIRTDLKAVRAPVLLIWGEHDTLVPPAFGHVLQQGLPDARLLILKNAGHIVMYDRPEICNRAMLEFLA